MDRKLKVMVMSDFSLSKTGFGRFTKCLLKYLYKTDKYDIVQLAKGVNGNPEYNRTPWKTRGIIPLIPALIEQLNKENEGIQRAAHYGVFHIDEAIAEEKPDVFIGVEDIWGVDFCADKKWFKKITPVFHTTLDSKPIHASAYNVAKKMKNFWVWSNFAEKEMKKKPGYDHVRTVHGCIETDYFFPLKKEEKLTIRQNQGLNPDDFIIGFVGRNQLRKLFPNLIKGFKLLQGYGVRNAKLHFHTDAAKGYWDIIKLVEDNEINLKDVYFTYYCHDCKNYEIKNYAEKTTCKFCSSTNQKIIDTKDGVDEKQLNEIYNNFNVYCHPITSGGQEIPVQEAKLAGLITLVNDYSCGEELCEPEAYSITLDWAENWEASSSFIKASPYPSGIAKQLFRVYTFSESKRAEWGAKAREWALKNYSVESVGKIFEDFLDTCPLIEDFDLDEEPKDPYAEIDKSIAENKEFIKELYWKILKMRAYDDDEGGWLTKMELGMSREEVEQYFRATAYEIESKNTSNKNIVTLDTLLDQDDKKRIAIVMPRSIGDTIMMMGILKGVYDRYGPDYKIYYFTEKVNHELLYDNPYIHKLLPYSPALENIFFLNGRMDLDKMFDVVLYPFIGTQRHIDYICIDDKPNVKENINLYESSN